MVDDDEKVSRRGALKKMVNTGVNVAAAMGGYKGGEILLEKYRSLTVFMNKSDDLMEHDASVIGEALANDPLSRDRWVKLKDFMASVELSAAETMKKSEESDGKADEAKSAHRRATLDEWQRRTGIKSEESKAR